MALILSSLMVRARRTLHRASIVAWYRATRHLGREYGSDCDGFCGRALYSLRRLSEGDLCTSVIVIDVMERYGGMALGHVM